MRFLSIMSARMVRLSFIAGCSEHSSDERLKAQREMAALHWLIVAGKSLLETKR